MPSGCLVCREVSGEQQVPGGFLVEDDHVVSFHGWPLLAGGDARAYLGHLLVVTRRHAPRFADLTDAESAAVGRAGARLARALSNGVGADWVYSAVIGTHVPHFHLHLWARYADTPRDVPWHKIDEWEGARHGDATQVAEFAARVRAALGQ